MLSFRADLAKAWRGCAVNERLGLFKELAERNQCNGDVGFLYGCAALRNGTFEIARTAFQSVLVQWPESQTCRILIRACELAENLDLRAGPSEDINKPPTFTPDFTRLCWESSEELGINVIPENDGAQFLLIYAITGTAHLGIYVKCAGEIATRILGVVDLKCGIRKGIFPVDFCQVCGRILPQEEDAPCRGCGARWTREGSVLPRDKLFEICGISPPPRGWKRIWQKAITRFFDSAKNRFGR